MIAPDVIEMIDNSILHTETEINSKKQCFYILWYILTKGIAHTNKNTNYVKRLLSCSWSLLFSPVD
jgi:hypothetical protein